MVEASDLEVSNVGTWNNFFRSQEDENNDRIPVLSHLRSAQKGVQEPLEIQIHGPYGAPFNRIFWTKHAVLIGAGIGVTPFASILQSVLHRHLQSKITCPCPCNHAFSHNFQAQVNRLRKVDFFWINKDQQCFEWFLNLLSNLEIEQQERNGNMDRFLDIHMYMTRALKRSGHIKAVGLQLDLLYKKNKRDLIAGLRSRMNAGRPNWDEIFEEIAINRLMSSTVDVFYCGPSALIDTLRKQCVKHGFGFKTEIF